MSYYIRLECFSSIFKFSTIFWVELAAGKVGDSWLKTMYFGTSFESLMRERSIRVHVSICLGNEDRQM